MAYIFFISPFARARYSVELILEMSGVLSVNTPGSPISEVFSFLTSCCEVVSEVVPFFHLYSEMRSSSSNPEYFETNSLSEVVSVDNSLLRYFKR